LPEKILKETKNLDGVSAASGYENLFHHLFDELRLLNLRLLRELRVRQRTNKVDRDTSGLFVSEEEVVSMLNSSLKTEPVYPDAPEIESINRMIEEVSKDIAQRLSNTDNANFPLLRLARTFGLMPLELDILIMALAPEIDKRYERVYAYFNDDLTKKAPSVGLVLDILSGNAGDKLTGWQFFAHNASLLHFNFICFTDTHEDGSSLNHRFMLDEHIKRFILGDNGLHASLSEIAQLYYPDRVVPDGSIQKDVKEKIIHLLSKKDKNIGRPVFWFYGKAKEEKEATALAICKEIDIPLLIADLEDIFFESDQRSVIKNLFREAALQSALVFLSGGDRLYGEDEKSELLKRTILRTINEISWITFIGADTLWMPEDTDGRYQWYPFEFKMPGYAERKRIWLNTLNGSKVSESDIDTISGRFNFSKSQIKNAVLYAKRFLNGDELTLDRIYNACSMQSNQRLSIYSAKVTPHYTWNDIVLPEDKMRQLREICNYIKHKHLVYFKWGFEKKLALGRGLNILFSGPSGTGKTMAADIIAKDLKLEMYKVDLSSVVSKYIGETEKNLGRVFKETSSGNAILFFDEADALFGKRSEVKDAHDRYANIEINYLLQKMEEHEGIVILATNLSKNIDDAFLRRIHFNVEFPFPDEKQRELIWRKIFPKEVPLSKDIDYRFFSERLKLAGGNIKNVALTAAFYAAEESSDIQMRQIVLAVKREYQKIGKTFVKADFEPYYEFME